MLLDLPVPPSGPWKEKAEYARLPRPLRFLGNCRQTGSHQIFPRRYLHKELAGDRACAAANPIPPAARPRAFEEVSGSYRGHLAAASPFEPGTTYGDGWWEEFADEQHRRDPCQGAIAVAHHGCTSYTLLVVSGPARGRLVLVDFNGVPAPYVLEDTDFLAWYERWLDELAAGYDVTRMSEKIPGGESELLAISVADSDNGRRARATWSCALCPR